MIIGHEHIIKYFDNLIKNDRLAHAYAFCGSEGIGKHTAVLYIAKKLFCVNAVSTSHNLDNCRVCASIINGTFANVIMIKVENKDTKKNISIEQIRNLRKKLFLKEMTGQKRLIVIDGAEFMNVEAANAFLKILEEPSLNIIFFLLVNSSSSLLPTIASRAQIIRFNLVSDAKIEKALISAGIDLKSAKDYTSLAYGRPSLAFSFAREPDLYKKAKDAAKASKYFISDFISERLKLPIILSGEPQEAALQINRWLLALNNLMKEQLRKGDSQVIVTIHLQKKLLNLLKLVKDTNINIRLALEKIIFER